MKVLHITNHYAPCLGGIESFVKEIAEKMQAKGIKTTVLALNSCHNGEKIPSGKINKIHVIRIPYLNLHFYKINPFILKYFKQNDTLIFHGIGFFSDFALITKFIHRKKIFIFTHGGIFHTKSIPPLKKIYFNVIEKFLLKRADLILADSENDYNIFKKICNKNILLFEIGVDTKKYQVRKKKSNQFLCIGRLSKNKRIDLLIKQAKSFLGENGKLIIAGVDFDNILEDLTKIVKEENLQKKVIFVGKVSEEEKIKLLAESEYFVSASEYEGFGLTLIEAMASACIPIVQNNTSFKKLVQDGKNGFLVDYKKSFNIKLNNKQKITIRKNTLIKAKEFDLDKKIDKLIMVLK